VSLIAVGLSSAGIFFINMSMFTYIPFCYPKYAASLLAANSLAKSLLVAAAILFAPPMFKRLA
jgi:DHA1 family multidrug resistance protein-like MFS transporter